MKINQILAVVIAAGYLGRVAALRLDGEEWGMAFIQPFLETAIFCAIAFFPVLFFSGLVVLFFN